MDVYKLIRPFKANEINTRQGHKNIIYKYVPSEKVIERLSELGPLTWSFIVKESKEIGNEIVVLGSLRIGNTVKDAFGSATIDDKRTAGNAFKSASSLSLVKAASLYGIPCVFNSDSQGNYQYVKEQHQIRLHPEQENTCEDCGEPVSKAVVNYSRKQSEIFNNKIVCQRCQESYRNMRRVK